MAIKITHIKLYDHNLWILLIYGDGTRTTLLRIKWRFQLYISFVETIKDYYETQPKSSLKHLNKCGFYMLVNNRLWRANTLEYKIDSLRFLDSSHDKEHDDAQFLQFGVSMAKLQPLLNH